MRPRKKVILVGAGPGDPGLVTRKGLDYISEAEVVIYDRLVNERLLEHVPVSAERIYVGKGVSRHTMTQEEINELLVDKAGEGKMVVRLKGGDPFVLGRGGEEAEVLAASGIPFEVVPGITAAIAAPMYAGIPVTHRGLSSSFAVITGHEDPGKHASAINWEKLATGVDTLVFLMGMKNLPQICSELIRHGRPGDTPVAIIKEGTSSSQKTLVGTLEDIATRAAKQRLDAPAVIVVGDVVRLRTKLRWFDNRPLSGKRVLVTRARRQASKLIRFLSELGAEPVELPAIEIQLVDDTEMKHAVENLDRYHWLLFTSVNGVEAFFQCLHRCNLDTRALRGISVGAIGQATATSLSDRGIIPDYVPEVYTTEGIVAGLASMNIVGKRFLLPRADIVDERLSESIRQLGGEAHEVTAYRTVPAYEAIKQAKELLRAGEIDVITFTSSSTVANLVAAFEGEEMKVESVKIASIGPKTTESARKAGLKVDIVAREHTIEGLVRAIQEYFTPPSCHSGHDNDG